MSTSDVSKSERVLEKIGARLGITEEGKKWVIAAVDPWHDTPINVRGFPDTNEAASVVQVVKMSRSISIADFEPSRTTPWDVQIHQFPWMQPLRMVSCNFSNTVNGDQRTGYGDILIGSSTTTPGSINTSLGTYGGLGVSFGTSDGHAPFTWANTTTITPFSTGLNPYLVGEYRVIAMGFEVINTTSDLNIQGLCTVYRQPMASLDSAKTVLATAGQILTGSVTDLGFGYPSIVLTNQPPIGTGEALLLEGSKQWKAKEGCYVVPTMNSNENSTGANYTTPMMHISSQDSPHNVGWDWGVGLANAVTVPSTWTALPIPVSGATYTPHLFGTGVAWQQPFNHAGAFFTGLSPATTLTINAIYYVERFPSQQDSELVVLAQNSMRQDCVAIDLYSEIIREMPVGVPQRMNGLGEWFADAVSSAVDFVSPVLSAIPHPIAQGAAMAAKTVKNVTNAAMGSKNASGATYAATGNQSTPMKKALVQVAKKKKKVPIKKK